MTRLSVSELDALGEIYVPGEFCCAKCGFTLSQFTLNATSGAVTDRDEPGKKCPNDGAPLWRVTWKQRSQEHYIRAVDEMARADSLAEEVKELREAKRGVTNTVWVVTAGYAGWRVECSTEAEALKHFNREAAVPSYLGNGKNQPASIFKVTKTIEDLTPARDAFNPETAK